MADNAYARDCKYRSSNLAGDEKNNKMNKEKPGK